MINLINFNYKASNHINWLHWPILSSEDASKEIQTVEVMKSTKKSNYLQWPKQFGLAIITNIAISIQYMPIYIFIF